MPRSLPSSGSHQDASPHSLCAGRSRQPRGRRQPLWIERGDKGFRPLQPALGHVVCNVLGCLLIGVIAGLGARSELLSSEARLLLATGFCGGFTTMSAFVYELGQYIQDKEFFFASGYFAATLAGAGLAFLAGLVLSAFLVR